MKKKLGLKYFLNVCVFVYTISKTVVSSCDVTFCLKEFRGLLKGINEGVGGSVEGVIFIKSSPLLKLKPAEMEICAIL